VASQAAGAVFVLDTGSNTVAAQVPVGEGPTAFGLFITPEAVSCDASELEQALAAAQRQVATLQVSTQALSSANQTLTEENARLRAELAGARATIDSFVNRLFGDAVDARVASAARAGAQAELAGARAAAAHDRRLRVAESHFEQGQQAMRRKEWGRAVHEFRQAHEMIERIRGDKYGHQHPPTHSSKQFHK
jgi:YVTN family beta-propeller protein